MKMKMEMQRRAASRKILNNLDRLHGFIFLEAGNNAGEIDCCIYHVRGVRPNRPRWFRLGTGRNVAGVDAEILLSSLFALSDNYERRNGKDCHQANGHTDDQPIALVAA